jgi:DNA primase
MSGRIVIPIRNDRGEIVAYAGRAVDDRPPKYKLPFGFRKAWELFNVQRAMATGSKTVILVEGYFDCLRVHQAGFPCVVGLMGSSLSPEQERVLVERFERVMLMLDGDGAGQVATPVISAKLTGRCHVVVVPVPDGMQPDQLAPTVVANLLLREYKKDEYCLHKTMRSAKT